MQADLSATLERFRADTAGMRDDLARRKTRLLLAVAGLVSFGVVILGILIRWPTRLSGPMLQNRWRTLFAKVGEITPVMPQSASQVFFGPTAAVRKPERVEG